MEKLQSVRNEERRKSMAAKLRHENVDERHNLGNEAAKSLTFFK